MSHFHDLEMTSITGEPVAFNQYQGQMCLLVNVASEWGLTPQYAGLRTLHEDNDGLTVLGFPCNQFGAQEPGSDAEILKFAQSNYDANFPLFAKIEVNGEGACELYQMLTAAMADVEGKADIGWNFTKFLVDGSGTVLARFSPTVTPEEIGEKLGGYR